MSKTHNPSHQDTPGSNNPFDERETQQIFGDEGSWEGIDSRDAGARPVQNVSPTDPQTWLRRLEELSAARQATLADGWRFTILTQIGQGGMGTVYSVRDNDLRRDVALKMVRLLQAAQSPEERVYVQRFIREAQITAQLQHPNIVPVYDFGRWEGGMPCLLMPILHGNTLATLLTRMDQDRAPDQLESLIDHFLKTCDAVAYAHHRGVIHRDIKPSNIFVGNYGEVRLMDWGIARIMGEEEVAGRFPLEPVTCGDEGTDPSRTLTGQILGTPQYMPPEQACGRHEEVDERSDVFALGGVLFRCLTGRPPNFAGSFAETLRLAKAGERPPTYSLRRWPIPGSLAKICDRALAKNPRDRFASVQEMAEAVRRARRDHLRGTTVRVLLALVLGCVGFTTALLGLIASLTGMVSVDWTFWGAFLACSAGLAGSAAMQAMSGTLGVLSRGQSNPGGPGPVTTGSQPG
jgi:serine/threonine-protein kinase